MAKAKTPTVSVWCMRGGKITEVKGCRLGKEMVTLPDGQRWSRKRGSTEGFYDSEMEAAQAFSKMLPATLDFYRTHLAAYESLHADCKRVFEEHRRNMHALSAEVHGSTAIADAIWGGANGEPQVIDSKRYALTEADIVRAAAVLGVQVPALKTLLDVEARAADSAQGVVS